MLDLQTVSGLLLWYSSVEHNTHTPNMQWDQDSHCSDTQMYGWRDEGIKFGWEQREAQWSNDESSQ